MDRRRVALRAGWTIQTIIKTRRIFSNFHSFFSLSDSFKSGGATNIKVIHPTSLRALISKPLNSTVASSSPLQRAHEQPLHPTSTTIRSATVARAFAMRDPFDRLLHGMVPYHAHFRHAHAQLMQAVPNSQSMSRFNLQSLHQQSLQLCRSLEMHHTIEETYIFPLLAVKLPDFGTKDPVHIREHQAMHEKLEVLEHYSTKTLRDLQSSVGKKLEAEGCGKEVEGEEEDDGKMKRKEWPTSIYDSENFDSILRELAAALFPHLEAEEKSLRGSNLKAHGFTLQDLQKIPM